MKSLALFSGLGGVGNTTLTFNIAHLAARTGLRTVALDFDPQSNLSALFLKPEVIADLWGRKGGGGTVAACLDLDGHGTGRVMSPVLLSIADDLWLLPGHLDLARFDSILSEEWSRFGGQASTSVLEKVKTFAVLANEAAEAVGADLVMIDVGPSLSPLNRSTLLACDGVIFSTAPDLFGLQGLRTVGPVIRKWRHAWNTIPKHDRTGSHEFLPIGYVFQERLPRDLGQIMSSEVLANKIPEVFRRFVLDDATALESSRDFGFDTYCLSRLKYFSSLVPLAEHSYKPVFDLKMADGIGSGLSLSVLKSRLELENLLDAIRVRLGL